MHEVLHNGSTKLNAALKPVFPADVAAWKEHSSAVDYDEFGMHDAERLDEDGLHLHVQSGQSIRVWQTELRLPLRGTVCLTTQAGGVEKLLEERR